MIIHDFNIVGVSLDPTRADAPLVVHANIPLAFGLSLEDLSLFAGGEGRSFSSQASAR